MSVTDPDIELEPQTSARWVRHGLANTTVVIVLSVVSWWLLADPSWSPLSIYPLPFNGFLFWAIIFVVFLGFNLGFEPVAHLAQPWRALVVTAATAVFSITVTLGLAQGIGHFDPDFAADRAGGLGYFTAALFVLFAFGTYVLTVVNWEHWPWTSLGLRQPLVGWCEIAFWFIPTLALFLVLGLPTISESATAQVMPLDTVIGWFYCIIIAIVLTGSTLENRPWRRPDSPGLTAMLSTLGTVALGTILYFALTPVVSALLGSSNVEALGSAIDQYPAQLGVCWVFAMVLWANAFGNISFAGLIGRVIITFAIAVAVFLAYFHGFAQHVLHEPPVAEGATIHGNGLGFVNWMILFTLLYVVAGDSWGLKRPQAPAR